MALDTQTIERCGDELFDALSGRIAVAPLRDRVAGITIADGYRIQERMVSRMVAAGDSIVGKKIGVTSKAVQDMMQVFEPDFGQLTASMAHRSGAVLAMDTLIQPRIEGEIAFILKHDLAGPGLTAVDVLAATAHVVPCFEVVDSRITNWDIRIQDTISDNASCGAYVLGDTPVDPRDIDLTLVGMLIERNGELTATGVGAAVQGSPVNAVVWLVNRLGELGVTFRASEVILSGSLAALVPVVAGDRVVAHFGGLGSCEVSFQ
ncbi:MULTISPECIES: fumarylacetoacetate hydrolase family protein [Sphingomonadaceae]|uniref:fumarylacetoacetate hydrolase family protein n=1 Tax=Sphingomonadales TaxID=204457 RepID=UPI0005CC7873|nr:MULTISPECIES: fumarylacetoacetate hydrolase family protein [Sphingomonadaceae]AJR26781.1 2-keto-4-pentenoate hydratase [Sphingobium sp. YBL2]KKC24314.1 2-keto-4-pentenoate hydratase [Sphingomonas sp. SRS2]